MERFATELEYQNSNKDKVSYVVESDMVHYPAKTDPYPWKIIWTGYIPSGGYDENRVAWGGGYIGTDEKLIQYPLDFFDKGNNDSFLITGTVGQNVLEIYIPKKPVNTNGSALLTQAKKLRKIEFGDLWENDTIDSNLINTQTGIGTGDRPKYLEVIYPKKCNESYFNAWVNFCIFPEECNYLSVPAYYDIRETAKITIPKGVKEVTIPGRCCAEITLTGPTTSINLPNDTVKTLIIEDYVETITTGYGTPTITKIVIGSTKMPGSSPIIAKTIGPPVIDSSTGKVRAKGTLVIPAGQRSQYINKITGQSPYLINPNDLDNWDIIER